MPDQKDLELLILGHTPILQIETSEEKRTLRLLANIAMTHTLPIYQWAATEGLKRLDIDLGVQRHNLEPKDVLAHIKSTSTKGIFVLLDFEAYIQDPLHTRFIKEIAMKFDGSQNKLVLMSHKISVPGSLHHSVARFELSLPDEKALTSIVKEEARRWEKETGKPVACKDEVIKRMVSNLGGLTHRDARRLARNALVDDDAYSFDDLPELMRTKYQLLNRDEVISYEYDTARFSDVGGMAQLKQWLHRREKAFHGEHARSGLEAPKGVLLLGVQGCGKSLAAKAIAGIWKVPLLRLDFAALYNKYIGESESNLRAALKMTEVLSPCVLWIDEIEKGISSGNDDGTSKRILGAFLTWLAERDANVFVVATANNIDDLPPELIRKGRLDEIFFVDLPDASTRKQIFSIYLEKRQDNIASIDLDQLASASEGFSGAEIEQVVVSALYSLNENHDEMTTAELLGEIVRTRPLSVVMAEQINHLRQWASTRTVAVD